MLQDSNGNWWLVIYNKQEHCHWLREHPQPNPRWVWWQKQRRLRFCWSTISPEENPIIQGYDSRLCLFSYYQIHPTSINKTNGVSSSKDGVTADVQNHSYSWKSRIASSFLFKTMTLRKKWLQMPPNGFISSFLVLLTTIGILTILTGANAIVSWAPINGLFHYQFPRELQQVSSLLSR